MMAKFNKITPLFIKKLTAIVGGSAVYTHAETLEKHARDFSQDLYFLPEAVVIPSNTSEVSGIMALCNKYRIPVTVQGARSGLTGSALAIHGGVALSMERFDKILDIDEKNYQVIVEPGVITEHLQNILQDKGLFYPPDPAGRGYSHIGGNIATNAGGPRCVKYGVTRDYVLNLEIVLPNGEVMWTGANTLKNSTGYNLTQLITGSEGTLAVVTKIVLKLLPYPPFNLLMLALFRRAEEACAVVADIFRSGVIPSALEFMDRETIDYAVRYVGSSPFAISPDYEALLLIEVDGNNMDVLQHDCEKIAEVLSQFDVGDILFADSEAQKNELWKLRRNAANAITTLSYAMVTEDTVVPRTKLPDLLKGVKKIGDELGLKTSNLGHIGDGNIHFSIISEEPVTEEWRLRSIEGKREIYKLVQSLGGMLSAEHGIGYLQKPFMELFFKENHLSILRGIKKAFDPRGILNPAKIFD
ncbi:MAG: FAD-linked oxidase C-terminal domain-containing protein [Ginsengibacter sp.]